MMHSWDWFKKILVLALVALVGIASISIAEAKSENWLAGEEPNLIYLPQVKKLENPRWMGPDGGSVVCLAVAPTNPDIVYAGTLYSGVYKSTNAGRTWASTSNGIVNLFIDSLTVDPTSSSIVYAGTHGNGVYKSINGGDSWFPVNNGIAENSVVYTVAVNPGNHDLVYAGTRIQNTEYHGILYKSVNGGASWQNVMDFSYDWVYSIVVNPNQPNIVLAAVHTDGPQVSKDYGNKGSWVSGTPPLLPSDLEARWIKGRAAAFDPRPGTNRAYYTAWHDGFISYSLDNGKSWSMAGGDLGSSHIYPNGISINPTNANIAYLAAHSSDVAGVLRSTDAGKNWYGAGLLGKTVYSVAALGGGGDSVLAGTYMDGLYRSNDGGANWSYSMSGILDSKVTGIVFPGGNTVYGSTKSGGGVFRSQDGGSTWNVFNSNLGDSQINGLVLQPGHPNILFALTNTVGLKRIDTSLSTQWNTVLAAPAASTLSLSKEPFIGRFASPIEPQELLDPLDAGLETSPLLSTSAGTASVLSLAFAPSNANIAYLGTNGAGVFASTNGGIDWSPIGLPGAMVRGLAVQRNIASVVYAATNENGVLKVSKDGGNTWTNLNLPDSVLSVYSVVIWPGDPQRIYVGTNNGIYRYGASTWEQVGLTGYQVLELGFNPGAPAYLFAGTDRGGFRSSIDGLFWEALATNELNGLVVSSLNFNPADPAYIYVGTENRGTLKVYLP